MSIRFFKIKCYNQKNKNVYNIEYQGEFEKLMGMIRKGYVEFLTPKPGYARNKVVCFLNNYAKVEIEETKG